MMKPIYNTKTFVEIYEKVADFTADYTEIGLGGLTTSGLIDKLYYLLYAKFGNSPIANMDVNQFKYKLFSIVFQYGPAWDKRLEIQETLRGLQETDLLKGSKAIYNHALNPETLPKTGDLDELDYINEQNTTNYVKTKMDAYTQLWTLIATDVTSDFLNRFVPLFKSFVAPEYPILYEDEED